MIIVIKMQKDAKEKQNMTLNQKNLLYTTTNVIKI